MANERKTSLLEIYQNFLDEAELLESEIKENEFSIEETTDYLDQLYNPSIPNPVIMFLR